MLNAIRGTFARESLRAGIWGLGNSLSTGFMRRNAGRGAIQGAFAMNRLARMGDVGLSATLGAVGGGIYGAASDDTSVLGGAFMGAGLGIGGLGAVRGGAAFARNYRNLRPALDTMGPRMGMGRAAYRAAARTGAEAKQFFGAQLRANGPVRERIRGLGQGLSNFGRTLWNGV